MKLTESRIKQIILEELDNAQQAEQGQEQAKQQDQQDETKTLQELKNFLLNLSKQATQIKGASPAEVKAAAELIMKILKSLPKGEIATYIKKTDEFFSSKTGNK